MARRLRIGQIEGDAIFGLGEKMPPRPIEWIEECFVEYQRRLRDIQEVTTCPCRACTNVGSLTLKFVAHYGEYLPQRIGDKETYVGRDVNIVHRLLKNSVPSREYLLVTAAFREHMPATSHTGLVPHVEHYDVGEVSGAYLDLAALSKQARETSERRLVESDHARVSLRRSYTATHEQLWHVLTDPEAKRRWLATKPKRVDYQPGARGTMLGSEYHCEHGGSSTVFRVVSSAPPDQLTMVFRTPLALVWETCQVRDQEPGQVELVRNFHWERAPGLKGWLVDALQSTIVRVFEAKAMKSIDPLLRESVPGTAPSDP
jgi:uncharacterized protein YndB with AHSA1/START domain